MMTVYNLAPWRRKSGLTAEDSDLRSLRGIQREIDSVFDNFLRGFSFAPAVKEFTSSDFLAPNLDIAETDREYQVSLELPGVDENDVDISLSGNILTIKGEKKAEEKKDGKNYHRVERSYGSFQRSLTLPDEVNADKITATFQQGVLHLTVPKLEQKKTEVKKINIKSE